MLVMETLAHSVRCYVHVTTEEYNIPLELLHISAAPFLHYASCIRSRLKYHNLTHVHSSASGSMPSRHEIIPRID
ncbi:hypothetical protein OUZ56_028305 [Daphnia magna]|uniref:Uncharacterized protein n=1 Tax=Daphnia magna TaxID=35525 RepID=A0ABR0B3K9_9CRUS|nr:hypothetical protein OUZ56_028305 [Daphnia magna]